MGIASLSVGSGGQHKQELGLVNTERTRELKGQS